MFGLTFPRRRTSPPSPRRTTPSLEILEGRDCPSYLTLNLTPGLLQNVTLSGDLTCAPNVAYQTGDLTCAPNVAYQTIDLHGRVPCHTQVQTDANGHYCITLQATGLGEITATADDGSSNTATVAMASPPPVVTKFVSWDNSGIWTFIGKVVAPPNAGLTATIDDGATLQNNPVKLRPDGSFIYSVRLNPAVDPGRICTLTATDCWGQTDTGTEIINY
jgi:hypothetical protein